MSFPSENGKSIPVRTVFRLWLAASQWKPEHYIYMGRRKDGRPRTKRFCIAGNYFLRWAYIGEYRTEDEAKEVARKIASEDRFQHEFIIREIEIKERTVRGYSFSGRA